VVGDSESAGKPASYAPLPTEAVAAEKRAAATMSGDPDRKAGRKARKTAARRRQRAARKVRDLAAEVKRSTLAANNLAAKTKLSTLENKWEVVQNKKSRRARQKRAAKVKAVPTAREPSSPRAIAASFLAGLDAPVAPGGPNRAARRNAIYRAGGEGRVVDAESESSDSDEAPAPPPAPLRAAASEFSPAVDAPVPGSSSQLRQRAQVWRQHDDAGQSLIDEMRARGVIPPRGSSDRTESRDR